jgi:hypothetical protein
MPVVIALSAAALMTVIIAALVSPIAGFATLIAVVVAGAIANL